MSALGEIVLLATVVVIGLRIAWSGVRPRPASLQSDLARLYGPPPQLDTARRRPVEAVGAVIHSGAFGRLFVRVDPVDLRILGRSSHEEAARRAGAIAVGLSSGPVAAALLELSGVRLAPALALATSIVGTLYGVAHPMRTVPKRAAERRRAYRWQLAMFLLAVGMCLSAGHHIESAIKRAASAGRGGLLDEINRAIGRARLHREPPWTRIRSLGEELGLDELADVAENVALAGEDGASIRETVSMKADALMGRILTEDEAEANAATESMHWPSAALLFAGMALAVVPAMSWAMESLT